MATILSQSRVCDGFDCRCRLADGSVRVFHFPAEPALGQDVQAAVDQVEAALPAILFAKAPPPDRLDQEEAILLELAAVTAENVTLKAELEAALKPAPMS